MRSYLIGVYLDVAGAGAADVGAVAVVVAAAESMVLSP